MNPIITSHNPKLHNNLNKISNLFWVFQLISSIIIKLFGIISWEVYIEITICFALFIQSQTTLTYRESFVKLKQGIYQSDALSIKILIGQLFIFMTAIVIGIFSVNINLVYNIVLLMVVIAVIDIVWYFFQLLRLSESAFIK